jgi:hypothetical protein
MIEIIQKFAEVFCYATIGVILKVLPALRASPNPFPLYRTTGGIQ